MENQTGKRIECIRTDNGLEICNQRMDSLCKVSGIKRHKTCPYTPQHNIVSERMNRTIMDKVRAMLSETGLDESYWAEAALTAVYIINRSPNASIKFEVLEARWMGSDLEYGHLRSFGCIAYVHQVKEKINPRATRGIFLGYAQGTKGYRVWLLEEEKVVISKDVVFNEERFFKDLKKEEDQEALQKEVETKITKKKVTFSNNLEEFEGESSNSGGAVETQSSQTQETTEEEMRSEADSETEEPQTHELDNYLLARDRERRTIKPPSKFEDADYLAYALSSAEDL